MSSFDLSDLAKLLQQGQGKISDSMGGVPLGVLGGSDSTGGQSMPMAAGMDGGMVGQLVMQLLDGEKKKDQPQYEQLYGGIPTVPQQEPSGGSAKGALSSLFG